MRRLIIGIFAALLCVTLTGCWNYQDITELDIVSGIAVDKDEETGLYHLTLEIVNVAENSGGMTAPIYAESEGTTIFDAFRNSKKRLSNKFFLGNTQVIIISCQLAESEGIFPLIDWILRNAETRETMNLIISQEDTARALLFAQGIDMPNDAFNMRDIIIKDQGFTLSTQNVHIYQAYNAIKGKGTALVLPTFRCVSGSKDNEDSEITVEVSGLALFHGDKLIGFMPPEDVRYFLIAGDKAIGGPFSFGLQPGDSENISFEIKKSTSKISIDVHEGHAKITLEIQLSAKMFELKTPLDTMKGEARKQLEERAAEVLEQRVSDVITHAQYEYGVDIWGFGNEIYKKDPELWASVEGQWDDLFRSAAIDVNATVSLMNTGITGGY